jgi:hypothetical protein
VAPYDTEQRINGSYHFLNRRGLAGSLLPFSSSGGDDNGMIIANSTYWMDATPFDGSAGVGCGTLANCPATCTTGVGYWATSQSCTDLTGMVGADPASPLSGVLYTCTAPNTWSATYSLLTYPHP